MHRTHRLFQALSLGWRVILRGRPPSVLPQSPATLTKHLAVYGILLLLAGCGADHGDPKRGRRLFNGEELIANGNLSSCSTCHAITPAANASIGPNLSNIGNRAATTVPGQTAEEYLRIAILDPDAYLARGYQEGIMNRDYPRGLSAQQINDLIAYMQTLKSGQDE